jgi:hypothetical protein
MVNIFALRAIEYSARITERDETDITHSMLMETVRGMPLRLSSFKITFFF